MHTIVCVYSAPIPVGHRVECQWFSQIVQGILSGEKTYAYNHEPIIKDLDTGIEYCSERPFERSRMKIGDQPIEISDQPGQGVQITHRMTGTVRRCRVVSLRGYSDYDVQTHLLIEPG